MPWSWQGICNHHGNLNEITYFKYHPYFITLWPMYKLLITSKYPFLDTLGLPYHTLKVSCSSGSLGSPCILPCLLIPIRRLPPHLEVDRHPLGTAAHFLETDLDYSVGYKWQFQNPLNLAGWRPFNIRGASVKNLFHPSINLIHPFLKSMA